MRFDDFYITIYKELLKKGFQITLTGVKEQLLQHPYYPSLQAVTDYLTDLDIPNTVVRINFDQLKDALTEAEVIVLTKDDGGDDLVWIKEIKDNTIYYSGRKSETTETFRNKWDGVALLLQIEKSEAEEDYSFHQEKNKYSKKLQAILIAGFVCILAAYGLSHLANPFAIYSLIPKIGGLLFSILLVAMELGFKIPVTEKLCSISTGNGCEKVTQSRMSSITRNMKLADLGTIYFSSVLLYQFSGNSNLLACIAILCIPLIVVSILYQTFKLKVFCPLCLSVMFMLLLDILGYTADSIYSACPVSQVGIYDIISLFGIALMIGGGWFIIKELIQRKNSMENYQYQYYQLVRKPERINNFVQCSPENEIGHPEYEILIGDPKASLLITEVMNPYCSPCGDSMRKIVQFLNIFETGLQFQILFISKKSNKEKCDQFIAHLLAYVTEHDQDDIISSLLDWFRDMDYIRWSTKYPIQATIDDEQLTHYLSLGKELKISHTPTIFVNNKRMSIEIGLQDLRYYIDDKIPFA